MLTLKRELTIIFRWVQVSYADFQEFASLRKELHKLQVALEFYQKTTGQFTLGDLKVGRPVHCCSFNPFPPPPLWAAAGPQQAPPVIPYLHRVLLSSFAVQQSSCLPPHPPVSLVWLFFAVVQPLCLLFCTQVRLRTSPRPDMSR